MDMNKIIILIFMLLSAITTTAQEIDPTVSYTGLPDEDGKTEDFVLRDGETASADAPLNVTCKANVDCPTGYSYKLEWRFYEEKEGEDKPFLTRFEDDMTYTFVKQGTMGIKLLVTFTASDGTQTEDEKTIKITISGSKLSCPDGFSPNGDGINDKLKISCNSIVKCTGCIFNRWGQRLHTFTVENIRDGWDGMVNGNPVKDGVYFINIDAYGADGTHYKLKKAINVLKGYREGTEGGSENG